MFKKGESGNPKGRPKYLLADGRSLAELARTHTETAIEALVTVLGSKEETGSARVSAATAILDRGWGRPKQEIDLGEETTDALADIILARRKRLSE